MQTFITIHDQDLLLGCESVGQFSTLSNVTYLFVGSRPVDRIPSHVNHIVCRNYTPNMEHLPDFYDYTGWYVLSKFDLISSPHVLMLQYDMHVLAKDLEAQCQSQLTSVGMIAFQTAPIEMLLLDSEEFGPVYCKTLAQLGAPVENWLSPGMWPTSQGTAWRSDVFLRYMEWFYPCFDAFAGNRFCGHLAERTLAAYTSLHTNYAHLPGAIQHDNRDCHGTCNLLNGQPEEYERKRLTFAR